MYGTIDTAIWNDAKFRALSAPKPNAQTLWLYLLAPRERCLIPGLIPAGIGTISESLRWPYEAARACLSEIEAQGMAEFDQDGPLVWLPNAFRHNAPRNQHQVTGWGKAWKEIPDCPLKHRAWLSLRQSIADLGEQFEAAFLASFPEPSTGQTGGTVPLTVTRTVRGNRPRNSRKNSPPNRQADGGGTHEQEHDHEQEAAAAAASERAREAAPEAPLPPPVPAEEPAPASANLAPEAIPGPPEPTAAAVPPASASLPPPRTDAPPSGDWWARRFPEAAEFKAGIEAILHHPLVAPRSPADFAELTSVLQRVGVANAIAACGSVAPERERRHGRILKLMYFVRDGDGPGMLAKLAEEPPPAAVVSMPRRQAGTVGPGCAPIVETLRERIEAAHWAKFYADASWHLEGDELVLTLGPSCPAGPEFVRDQHAPALLQVAHDVVGHVVGHIRVEAQQPRQAAGGGM